MKVLMLSRYGYLGPGSRVRMYQYLPYLQSRGVEVTVAPLLDDDYVRRLYARQPVARTRVLAAYAERVARLLLQGRKHDLIWLQWELLPWLPGLLETRLYPAGVPIVSDYDDAIFHRYDRHSRALVRRLLGDKIDRVMRASTSVVVGNEYLGERARRAGARSVRLLPSVIDRDKYQVAAPAAKADFVVGWIGTPSTSEFLQVAAPALARFCSEGNRKLVVVGANGLELSGVPVEYRTWTEDTEVAEIQGFDVGIMPLVDDEWSRGKCGYKLIQYMACGKPVIGSPVGVNARIVDHGTNGYHATNTQEWYDALCALQTSSERRAAFGASARAKIEEEYCVQVAGPRLYDYFREALAVSPPSTR